MAALLLIDDKTAFRQRMAVSLKKAGHEVLQTGSGQEALELYRRHRVQAVITAILMPDRDGIEVIREILSLGRSTPVVAMSSGCAICGLDVGKLALGIGADRVLEKPFTSEALLQVLAELLDPGDDSKKWGEGPRHAA